jgi:hypothetical protein
MFWVELKIRFQLNVWGHHGERGDHGEIKRGIHFLFLFTPVIPVLPVVGFSLYAIANCSS